MSLHHKLLGAIACVLSMAVLLWPAHAANAVNADGKPKVANWYFKWSIDSEKEARELAERDLLILDITMEKTSRDKMQLIRKLNPDIIILAYVSLMDIRPDAAELADGFPRTILGKEIEKNPGWVVKKPSGELAHWWENYLMLNVTNSSSENENGEKWNEYLPRYINAEVVEDKIWDGVFYDNVWEGVSFVGAIDTNNDGQDDKDDFANKEWRKGIRTILKKTRSYAKKNRKGRFYVTGNSGVGYHDTLNGVGFEHFPNTSYGKWTWSMKQYNFIIQNARPKQLAITNTNVNNTGKLTNYRKFRFGLMSTLLNDGYYSFDNGDQSHVEIWNYDEYEAVLGQPTSGAYNLLRPDDPTTKRRGVWRRDYAKAIVIVNSTKKKQTVDLRTGFDKLEGTQDPKVNSGDTIGKVTIPKRDGILLLRRQTEVEDATYINGAYTKVFGFDGDQKRKSFFSYDGRFPGNTQVHKIVSKGRTIVADDTRVRVYNNRNQEIASFAPYGDGYTGGVNLSVGTLYGGKKNYIVTGRKSGSPLVRIFDLKGNVKHPGCFPFAESFQGGVNVAMGDLNGDKRQEIIVAAGFGGGPQIRVLNNNCEVINPGFFAFPEHWRIGVNMAVGDVNGDNKAEIIAAPGPGGGSHVRIFNRKGKLLSPGFFAYGKDDRSGVLVATGDVDQDGTDEIITNSFSFFNPF